MLDARDDAFEHEPIEDDDNVQIGDVTSVRESKIQRC